MVRNIYSFTSLKAGEAQKKVIDPRTTPFGGTDRVPTCRRHNDVGERGYILLFLVSLTPY